MQNSYIENNDFETALTEYLKRFSKLTRTEKVTVQNACGRITAEAVFARLSDPAYNAAAMDGIAVNSTTTEGATELTPITLTLHGDFEYINTGNLINSRFNSVIMTEDVMVLSEGTVQITAASHPWQNIRAVGESVAAGELILPSFAEIKPAATGALAASGAKTVKVLKRPRIGIIPTGREMVDSPDKLAPGKLMESNSIAFAASARIAGAVPKRYAVTEDDTEALKTILLAALQENDAVIINAGSSAGTKDFTASVISALGEVVTHGLAIRPGKPTILGVVSGKPVIGIPGYPVSANLVFERVVVPVLNVLSGKANTCPVTAEASLTRRVVSSFKHEEFVRVSLGEVLGILVTTPLERGAAAVMSLVKADGILKIPRLCEGLEAGEKVKIELLNDLNEIKKALVVIGSHDLIIDVISDVIPVKSSHTGSTGGITAMLRRECHVAPIHLLDEETVKYNIPYVKRCFEEPMILIKGVGRVQGLYSRYGADVIKDISDIKEKGLMFANRQRGAGTRILFDAKLKEAGISQEQIRGYEKEFITHLAVAAAVKEGSFNTGLGIFSAAKAMGLNFTPVGNESYDFLVRPETLDDPRLQQFIAVLRSKEFKRRVASLGGYTLDGIGEIIRID
ncbi:MAG: molybdopterin biosynthesis protein [Clostridiaceae bacterium]|jgi:putative molybdopterin biosynthesis protein|nr:molybdopterin biosynthesis protein [Clostridiaceae bacterium]